MQYIYTLLILLCLSFKTNAQCSIKDYKSSDGTAVKEASFEVLYKNVGDNNNGDYSRGFAQVHTRLVKMSKQNPFVSFLEMQVAVSGQPTSNVLVPRRLVFQFVNGSTLTLDAATYREEGNIQLCEFEINSQNQILLKNPIRQVDIIDTRAELKYVSTKQYGLYDRLLAEQLSCLN